MRLAPEFVPSRVLLDAALDGFGAQSTLPDVTVMAVSGGSDSMALLRLARIWWALAGKRIIALTVDHGLRAESADEARQVAAWCEALGVEHHALKWTHDGQGNLSAAAREGRYRLMAEFCKAREIEHIYTGHTMDDQAETVLMRFARGSGVDGLAGMAAETPIWGITLMRPFVLSQTRESLRAILAELKQSWIDDPTNDDLSYDRVKARALVKELEPLGVTPALLASLAHRMDLAKRVLQNEADKLANSALTFSPLGFATLDVDALASAELETACRLIGQATTAMSGGGFRASLQFEEQIVTMARMRAREGGLTQKRCIFRPDGDRFHILREPERCAPMTQSSDKSGIWDMRFSYEIGVEDDQTGLSVGPIGASGLTQIPKEYDGFSAAWLQAPREARLTAPGLWRGDTLLSAPLAPWAVNLDAPTLRVRTVWPASC